MPYESYFTPIYCRLPPSYKNKKVRFLRTYIYCKCKRLRLTLHPEQSNFYRI